MLVKFNLYSFCGGSRFDKWLWGIAGIPAGSERPLWLLYFSKCISQIVFLKLYFSKCISQKVFLKIGIAGIPAGSEHPLWLFPLRHSLSTACQPPNASYYIVRRMQIHLLGDLLGLFMATIPRDTPSHMHFMRKMQNIQYCNGSFLQHIFTFKMLLKSLQYGENWSCYGDKVPKPMLYSARNQIYQICNWTERKQLNVARGTTEPGIASITWVIYIYISTKQAKSVERKL